MLVTLQGRTLQKGGLGDIPQQGETLQKQKKEVLSFYRKNLLASKD